MITEFVRTYVVERNQSHQDVSPLDRRFRVTGLCRVNVRRQREKEINVAAPQWSENRIDRSYVELPVLQVRGFLPSGKVIICLGGAAQHSLPKMRTTQKSPQYLLQRGTLSPNLVILRQREAPSTQA